MRMVFQPIASNWKTLEARKSESKEDVYRENRKKKGKKITNYLEKSEDDERKPGAINGNR